MAGQNVVLRTHYRLCTLSAGTHQAFAFRTVDSETIEKVEEWSTNCNMVSLEAFYPRWKPYDSVLFPKLLRAAAKLLEGEHNRSCKRSAASAKQVAPTSSS